MILLWAACLLSGMFTGAFLGGSVCCIVMLTGAEKSHRESQCPS